VTNDYVIRENATNIINTYATGFPTNPSDLDRHTKFIYEFVFVRYGDKIYYVQDGYEDRSSARSTDIPQGVYDYAYTGSDGFMTCDGSTRVWFTPRE
jgi:hypothetical protein